LEQLNERIFETKLKSYMGDSQHSLLHKKFPKLVNELDQEGLLSSKKVELVSDAIKYDGHIIGFDERIDYDLRKKLIEKINEGIEVKFKLSNFDITPIENYKHTIRKAKVYGRPFNADLLNKRLKDTSSHFVYQRYSEGEKIYSSFSLSNEKKFEVLKTQRDDRNFILTENIPSYTETPNYPITYIFHSDIKFDNVFFDHIDSSLLIYNKERFATNP